MSGCEQNPAFYRNASRSSLERIIEQTCATKLDRLGGGLPPAWPSCAAAEVRDRGQTSRPGTACQPVSLAIYAIYGLGRPTDVDTERHAREDAGPYVIDLDAGMRDVALEIEETTRPAHSRG